MRLARARRAARTSSSPSPVTGPAATTPARQPSTAAAVTTRRAARGSAPTRTATRAAKVGGTGPAAGSRVSSSTSSGNPRRARSAAAAPHRRAGRGPRSPARPRHRREPTEGQRRHRGGQLQRARWVRARPSSRAETTTRTGSTRTAVARWSTTAWVSASAHCRSSSTSRHGRSRPTSARKPRHRLAQDQRRVGVRLLGLVARLAPVRQHPGPRCSVGTQSFGRYGGAAAEQPDEGLGHRAVGPAAGYGAAGQHHVARRRPLGQLVDQPGLADARLASDENQTALARLAALMASVSVASSPARPTRASATRTTPSRRA